MTSLRQKGFSLLELLVVLLIIALLSCLIFPAINAMRRTANRSLTATRAQVIVSAIKAYKADYPTYPGQTQGAVDWTYDNSVANRRHSIILNDLTNNPRKKSYSELSENLTTNCYLDAWDRPYVIAMDENNDGFLTISNGSLAGTTLTFTSSNIQETVAIMSWGWDPSNSATWLYSWIR